jgi:hypothetical protein
MRISFSASTTCLNVDDCTVLISSKYGEFVVEGIDESDGEGDIVGDCKGEDEKVASIGGVIHKSD